MANRLILNRIDKITLVRKGRAVAKHPHLKDGVVDVVKASYDEVSPGAVQAGLSDAFGRALVLALHGPVQKTAATAVPPPPAEAKVSFDDTFAALMRTPLSSNTRGQ
jgi:hypothetical protein